MKPSLGTVQKWLHQCVDKPLDVDDPRYVALNDSEENRCQIEKQILLGQASPVQLVFGFPGLGCTTELARILYSFHQNNYIVLGQVRSGIDGLFEKLRTERPFGEPRASEIDRIFRKNRSNGIILYWRGELKSTGLSFYRDLTKECNLIHNNDYGYLMAHPEEFSPFHHETIYYPTNVLDPIHPSYNIKALSELVKKRIPVDKVFGDEQLLEKLIYYSGGFPRALLGLVRECIKIHYEQVFPISQTTVQQVLDQLRNRQLRSLGKNELDILARVHKSTDLKAFNKTEVRQIADCLEHLVVYKADTIRYEIHPLIKDQVLTNAKAVRAEQQNPLVQGMMTQEPDPKLRTLNIVSIAIENIRCFQELKLSLLLKDRPVPWTLILGNNATGKTSLLRAITLGLCDESTATALLKKVPGSFIRDGADKGVITLELVHGQDDEATRFTIRTEILPGADGLSEIVRKHIAPEGFSWQDIFVCAYGVERSRQADVSFDRYRMDQAVMNLFHYETSLQNPELVLLRQSQAYRTLIEEKLVEILMLDQDQHGINATEEGLKVSGPWGVMQFNALSDGYRGTVQWLTDFIAWSLYARRFGANGPVGGIVLLDELEQHLHPRWQRQIIARLQQQFPLVQFIMTTHSPLIAGSLGSVMPEEGPACKLLHLTMEDGQLQLDLLDSLKGMDMDQVLASPAFDYLIQADPAVEQVLAEA